MKPSMHVAKPSKKIFLPNPTFLPNLSEAGGAYGPLTIYPCPFHEPFPSYRWRCPLASQPVVPLISQSCLSSPPYPPFPCFGRLCQRSPRTFPVSLLRVGFTLSRATDLAIGQVRPGGHPMMLVESPSPTLCVGPEGRGGGGEYHPLKCTNASLPEGGAAHTPTGGQSHIGAEEGGAGGGFGTGGRGEGGGGSTLTNFGTVGTGIFFAVV